MQTESIQSHVYVCELTNPDNDHINGCWMIDEKKQYVRRGSLIFYGSGKWSILGLLCLGTWHLRKQGWYDSEHMRCLSPFCFNLWRENFHESNFCLKIFFSFLHEVIKQTYFLPITLGAWKWQINCQSFLMSPLLCWVYELILECPEHFAPH